MIFEENLVMVIERGVCVEVTVIDPKIKTHVVEDITSFIIHLFLGSGESIHEPIEGIILTNSLIDELGVLWRDISHGA